MIEFYKDRKGEWRWRAWARNGNILADSGEGYKRRRNAVAGARAALKVLGTTLPKAA